jgi:hypothetical protein
MENTIKNRKRFFFFPIVAIAFVFAGGYLVMQLWNYILPGTIAGVGELTYFKAIGLLILSKLLFGGFRGKPHGKCSHHEHHDYWKEKMMNVTDEDKEKFKAGWRDHCGRS